MSSLDQNTTESGHQQQGRELRSDHSDNTRPLNTVPSLLDDGWQTRYATNGAMLQTYQDTALDKAVL